MLTNLECYTDDDEGAVSQDDKGEVTTSIRREVNQYLKEKRWDIKCYPLEYWKANKMVYPRLASLARKYQITPPESAAPERLFSTAKQILKPTRLNVKPVNLESNLFLKGTSNCLTNMIYGRHPILRVWSCGRLHPLENVVI